MVQRKKSKANKGGSLTEELFELFKALSPTHRRQLGLLLILILVSSFSEMVSLGAIVPFLDALSQPNRLLNDSRWQWLFTPLGIADSSQLVTLLAFSFILAAIVANGLRLLTLKVQTHLSANIGSSFSSQVFQKTMQQPYQFHVRHNSSDLMQTLVDDTNRLTIKILMPLLKLISDAILAVALIGTLMLIDAPIAVSAAVILGTSYIVIYRLRQRLLKRNSKVVSQAGQRKIKFVQEGVGAIRDVLIAHTGAFFEDQYQDAESRFKEAQARNGVIAQSPKFVIEAIAMSAIALLALSLGQDGDFSQAVPVLGALSLGAKRLLPALQTVFYSLAQIQGSRTSLGRVLEALRRPVDPFLASPIPISPRSIQKELCLENVWFRYSEDHDWVLRGLNLKIKAKTTVGFVGATGSGKSTTADIILGLLYPQKGALILDGQSLDGESLKQWQQSIAHVPQSIFLIDASIAENIAFTVPRAQIDMARVRQAAKLAQIDEFIEALPTGYETYVGERGVRLSGGQRQRIGIARALYRQTSVILFDEATSALDNATEKEVMAAINGLSNQFTIILIAHRLSTVKNCDQIFELHQGKVLAQGNYEALLNESPSFRLMTQVSS